MSKTALEKLTYREIQEWVYGGFSDEINSKNKRMLDDIHLVACLLPKYAKQEDLITHLLTFNDDDGSKKFSRAKAVRYIYYAKDLDNAKKIDRDYEKRFYLENAKEYLKACIATQDMKHWDKALSHLRAAIGSDEQQIITEGDLQPHNTYVVLNVNNQHLQLNANDFNILPDEVRNQIIEADWTEDTESEDLKLLTDGK